MATQYTSLLGLALPVTGELSGTWGDTVNDSITSLLDTAVAGTTTLNTDADVTLSTTTGAANQARQAIILWTANGTTTRNITAPAQSKAYVVINKSAGTQSIVFRGVGPTTGVTIAKDEAALVAWNGSDFIKVSNINGVGQFTDLDVTGTTTLDALTASTALALNASKEIVSVTNTGTGNNVLATSPTLITPNLGTPSAVTLTNATGLPVSTGISGLGSGVATFLATPSSANLAAAVTDETGSGALVFATSPSLTTPSLGVATATSINKVALTAPATGSTLTIADGKTLTANSNLTLAGVDAKTLTVNNSLTLAGTDATTMTFPATSATIARTDAAQTFTGTQTFSGAVSVQGNTTLGDASTDTITLTGTVQPGVVISGSSSGDALRITQTGAGNALVVEDSANPDSTPTVIDANGFVILGATSATTALNPANAVAMIPAIQANATNSAGQASLGAIAWFATGGQTGSVVLAKSNSGTVGTHSAVTSGTLLGQVSFQGSDGTAFVRAADITAAVDGTPGTNDMPGRLVLSTTADGSATPTERLRISANGLSTFGSQAATGAALSTTAPAKIYTGTGTYTDSSTAASGTVTHGTINAFDNPAIAASNTTVTYSNASTLYIDGAPTAGTNVSITNPYSLFVNAGTVWFGGNVTGTDPVVQQSDIGSGPNEIPLNQYLGALAYEDTETPALDVGTGITGGTGTICKANGGLMGGIYQMTVLIDLTGLNSGGTAGDIIGVNGTALPCYIARLPAMTVLGGRMTCLETPAGGDTDIDLYSAAEGTGVEDQAITALTETEIINAGAQTRGTVTYFSADPAANAYFYLVGQGTANATYTAGRFLIEIFGV